MKYLNNQNIAFNTFKEKKRILLVLIFAFALTPVISQTIFLDNGKSFVLDHDKYNPELISGSVSFDWRMPARYGLDRNKNGIIDIPNTKEYVLNREFNMCWTCYSVRDGRVVLSDLDSRFPKPVKTDLFTNRLRNIQHIHGAQRPPIAWSAYGDIACLAPADRANEPVFSVFFDASNFQIPYYIFDIDLGQPHKDIQRLTNLEPSTREIIEALGPIIHKPDSSKPLQLERSGDGLIFIDVPESAIQDRADRKAPATLKVVRSEISVVRSEVAFVWSIQGSSGSYIDWKHIRLPSLDPEFSISSREFNAALPQGVYTVTLYLIDLIGDQWASVTETVTVKDYLIVALGDSYSSGEGTPELVERLRWVGANEESSVWKPYPTNIPFPDRQAHWADDGNTPSSIGKLFYSGTIYGFPAIGVTSENVVRYNQQAITREFLQHSLFRRSSFSASSQFALALEEEDKRSSVTYVNLAMSGAMLSDGIIALSRYKGSKNSPYYDKNLELKNQIDELENLLLDKNELPYREIDAIIMSFGGNDIGFSLIIEGLLARQEMGKPWNTTEGPSISRHIQPAVISGDWHVVNSELDRSVFQSSLDWSERPGLTILGSDHYTEQLNNRLNRFSIREFSPGNPNIFLLEYPTLIQHSARNSDICKNSLVGIKETYLIYGVQELSISAHEARWIRDWLMPNLNNTLKKLSQKRNWVYIDGIYEKSKKHGLCQHSIYTGEDDDPAYYPPTHIVLRLSDEEAQHRWFRELKEGAWLDSQRPVSQYRLKTTSAAAHPNEYGYKAVMKRIYEFVKPRIVSH